VEVVTDGGTYLADRVVVSSDAWTNEVLRDTGTRIPLTVTQEQVSYYATPNLREFSPERFPVFMWHGRDNFYGFPVYGPNGDRVCERAGASSVAEVDLGLPERWLYSFGSTLRGSGERWRRTPCPEAVSSQTESRSPEQLVKRLSPFSVS
jgi:glycine/D-amino acid oxidase-like deaminating enzyme